MRSFDKYIGGSPANMAVGMARLGLRSALITRVGNEHMGRFLREELAAEGVNTDYVLTDPERLTALVLLGIRDELRFPLIFYRENCADMALCEADIDAAFLGRARAVVATGTHLSRPQVAGATLKALRIARAQGLRTVLDIDYRPNLWGVAGHGEGESRFVESDKVTAQFQKVLPLLDVIVGTEEEFHAAGGVAETLPALRAIRKIAADAVLICKRGPVGAVAFVGEIPESLDEGQAGPGFPIEVFNVLGAGDGFMAGLMKGWLDGEDWPNALKYANACGALAVSRHGCAPAYPSWQELQFFLEQGVKVPALRKDAALEQLHWSSTRLHRWPNLCVFDCATDLSAAEGLPWDSAMAAKMGAFKLLCLEAAQRVAHAGPNAGVLCDSHSGRAALYAAGSRGLWIGRSLQGGEGSAVPAAQIDPELGPDFGALSQWPRGHVVVHKLGSGIESPEPEASQAPCETETLLRLFAAARRNRLEFLLQLSGDGACASSQAVAKRIECVYNLGVHPDWWVLPAVATPDEWAQVLAPITRNDAHTRGVLLHAPLGPHAPHGGGDKPDRVSAALAHAARFEAIKGVLGGRSLYDKPARAWLEGTIDDATAVAQMVANYHALCRAWDTARPLQQNKTSGGC